MSKKNNQQPAANNQPLTAKLSWLPSKTFELEFTLTWAEVKESYQKNLKAVAEKTTLKGFRQGKAPLDVVEKNLDKGKLYGLVLEDLLPQTYFTAVKQHQLKPICEPKITAIKTEEGIDWTFKATACEAPEVKLGDYEKAIKGLKAKGKIWLPGQDKTSPKKEKNEDEELKEIFQVLLKECQLSLPGLLIEEEEKRMLAKLLNQTQKLGLTLDEYCAGNHKTIQQLKTEYRQLADETLKLEFVLQAIAAEKALEVKDQEITDLIAAVPDEKTRENLATPLQKAYLKTLLKKRKAIDFLLKL